MGITKPGKGSEESAVIGKEIWLLKLFGTIRSNGDLLRVTEKGMYNISVMMQQFLREINNLRETCIEQQI